MNTKPTLIAILATALTGVAVPAFAHDAARQAADQIVNLKDGSALYVFKDGKMAKTDKFGRAVHLKGGEVLEAVDGRRLTASSNEVARLDMLLSEGHRN
jgi:hypothetical protein